MHRTHHHAEDGGIIVFAEGPVCCAVCVPRELRPESVENAISQNEPRGSVFRWRTWPGSLEGVPNPSVCAHHPGRHHWLLVRDLKR